AAIDERNDRRHHAAVLAHDVDRLLHAAAAGHHVFRDDEALSLLDREATTQDELPFLLLDEDVPLPERAGHFMPHDYTPESRGDDAVGLNVGDLLGEHAAVACG